MPTRNKYSGKVNVITEIVVGGAILEGVVG